MKKGALALAVVVGSTIPVAINKYLISNCPELPKDVVITNTAKAMPSFTRQTGFSCSTCHTIPPRLNSYGRVFKVRGYTDGNAIDPIIMGEGETILKHNPISVRFLSFPYSKEKGEDREVSIPDEVVVSMSGRVAENVGVFGTFGLEEGHPFELEILRIAFVKDLGNAVVGVMGGKTAPTGTDPFDSLNLHSKITRAKPTVWTGVLENSIPDIWDLENYGVSAYAYIANIFM